jgi:RNA polymerase sigma-70 factor (ECF subfamily)
VDFESIFRQLYPQLFRYCNRLLGDADAAEDVSQEAFVRLSRQEVYGDLQGVRVWLFRVATHLVRDRARTRQNRLRLLAANPVGPAEAERPDRETERQEEIDRVRGILDALAPRDRELLLMREEGFSYKEMAEAVGVAPGSVGTLIARALRRFSTLYLEQDERARSPE